MLYSVVQLLGNQGGYEMKKVECPVCGREGSLEIRGGSQRVVHYEGKRDGKLVLTRHNVGKQSWENGKQDKAELSFSNRNNWAGSSAWYECLTCTQEAGGSNPPQSIQPHFY